MKANFNKNDVIVVAKALVDASPKWDEGYINAMNPRDGYYCPFCNASEFQKEEDLKHDLNCPVLIVVFYF